MFLKKMFLGFVLAIMVMFGTVCWAQAKMNDFFLNVPSDFQKIVVSFYFESEDAPFGSGFLFSDGKWGYIITAKHVLVDPKNGFFKRDSVRLFLRADVGGEEFPKHLLANLKEMKENNEIFMTKERDSIALRFVNNRISGMPTLPGVSFIKEKSRDGGAMAFVTKAQSWVYKEIELTQDAFILGFPASLKKYEEIFGQRQIDIKRPLFRRAMVAGKNDSLSKIIIDGAVYFGNSGGPVVSQIYLSPTEKKLGIIGLVSEFIPYVAAISKNQNEAIMGIDIQNSGYAVVEPMDGILELIESSK